MLPPGAVAKPIESKSTARGERVFVKDGLRSFRRTYRLGEVYWGVGTGVLLLGILGWVRWKGDHPDPSLFDMSAALQAGPASAVVAPVTAPLTAPPPVASTGRGALPAGLAGKALREGKIGEYSADDLYVKIDGRAGYFQAFGVKHLHTITLEGAPGSEVGAGSIDIELYDLGEARNAIGAYNGERAPGISSLSSEGSTFHFDRNAGFLARGSYYARFIGSDESPAVTAEVRRLVDLFRQELPAGEVPWAFSLFVDQLKLSPAQVTYVRSNAFSFGFARDVFTAALSPADSKEDMEAFVVALADAAAARELAAKYQVGFASMGAAAGKTSSGVVLIKDEFLGTYSAATTAERWVVGLRGAPDEKAVGQMLERLSQGLLALPPEVRARALPSALEPEPAETDPSAGHPEAVEGSVTSGAEKDGSNEH